MKNIEKFKSIGDKSSTLGVIVSLMGCSMCFPAFASLGGVIGLGFLSQWEGLFINTLLPIFALLALLINLLGYFLHQQVVRTLVGILGPVILLLSLYPWFKYAWSTYTTYTGIGIMLLASLWDILSPSNKHCATDGCSLDGCNIEK